MLLPRWWMRLKTIYVFVFIDARGAFNLPTWWEAILPLDQPADAPSIPRSPARRSKQHSVGKAARHYLLSSGINLSISNEAQQIAASSWPTPRQVALIILKFLA